MLRRGALSLAAAFVSQLCLFGSAGAQEAAPPPEQQPPPPVEAPPPEAPPPAAPAPPAPAPAAGAPVPGEINVTQPMTPGQRTEEIVVTGTRIRRKDLTTPAPVSVINRDQIEASGKISVGDYLQALPEQGGGVNIQLNNGGDGSNRVNLRTLGTQRTLVLLNGRRFPVAGGNESQTDFTSVDLNAIPAAAIERIEILKDGASAVYGSDAVAGVINIITRKTFSGTDTRAMAGVSGHGDGQMYDLALTTGRTTDQGNIMLSAGFQDQTEIFARNRSFSTFDVVYDFKTKHVTQAGSTFIPGTFLFVDRTNPDITTGGNAAWQTLLSDFPNDDSFTRDPVTGQWRPYLGSHLATDPVSPGDGFNYQQFQFLSTPSQRFQLFSTGDVKLGEAARAYFEASFVNRRSSAVGLAPEPFDSLSENITISAQNFYNPWGLDFTPDNSALGRRLLEFGGRSTSSNVDTMRGILGVDGTLQDMFGPLKGWFWDVSALFGRTQGATEKHGDLRRDKFAAAVGPTFISSADGLPHCGTDAAHEISGCVPLDLFHGAGSITAAQITPLQFVGVGRESTQIAGAQANTSGEIVKLYADRPLALALGYEYRNVSAAFLPDPLTASGDATGNKGAPTSGSYGVHEAYAELSIPILSGLPYAENVEATAATRYSNYSSFGSKVTYKAGARWSVWNDLTFRGTFSTAFRAPSVGDLFQGRIDNFEFISDPCSGATDPTIIASCQAAGVPGTVDPVTGKFSFNDTRTQLRVRNGGTPTLKPETANIFTVGTVILPRWVKNLSFAVDYWNVNVSTSIASGLGGEFIMDRCLTGADPTQCKLITRASSGLITSIDDFALNIGKTRTSGIDFSGRYTFPTTFGRWGVNADATYLIDYRRTQPDNTVFKLAGNWDDSTDTAFPRWKGIAGATWGMGGFGAGLNGRFVNGFHECSDADGVASKGVAGQCGDPNFTPLAKRWVSPYAVFDIFGTYNLKRGTRNTALTLGVLNMFDTKPNQVYSGPENHTDFALYDYVGRFWYVRLSHEI